MVLMQIAEAVTKNGGRAFYVGGYVRNKILGKPLSDKDVNVFGLDSNTFETILNSICGKNEWSLVGRSYPVYKLHGQDIDIVIDSSNTLEENMQIEISRRDFTMNTLFEDILTGQIYDPANARKDIEQKIIKATTDEVFRQDPHRILRAARFAACLDFKLHQHTMDLIIRSDNISDIPKERVFGEMSNALLNAEKPSRFFEILKQMHKLNEWFPELQALIETEQNQEYHKEGDVWTHTMLVVDEAAKIRSETSFPLAFMLSALCHDFGKPLCVHTDSLGIVHTYTHELSGLEPVETFITRLTNQKDILKYVLSMTELHMRPIQCALRKSRPSKTNKVFDASICPEDLLRLSECDQLGRIPSQAIGKDFMKLRLKQYHETMSKPFVTGDDLIKAGVPSGKIMGEALQHAHKLRLAGIEKDSAMKQTLGYIRILKKKGKSAL